MPLLSNAALAKETTSKLAKVRSAYRDPEEVKAERAKADFVAWSARVESAFEAEWKQIQAAEAVARPHYEQAVAAYDAGKKQVAIKKLTKAREALFSKAFSSSVAFE